MLTPFVTLASIKDILVWRIRDKPIPEAIARGTIGSDLDKLSKGLEVTRKAMWQQSTSVFCITAGIGAKRRKQSCAGLFFYM
jgi:hypothetical protein